MSLRCLDRFASDNSDEENHALIWDFYLNFWAIQFSEIVTSCLSTSNFLLFTCIIHVNLSLVDTSGNQLRHRVVKHYGYAFDYKTNSADKMNPNCKSIPDQFKFIIQRFGSSCDKLRNWIPDQVTVNVYQPGQGIRT